MRSTKVDWLYILFIAGAVAVAFFMSFGHKLINSINDEIALTHFTRLAGTEDVVIVSHTNDNWIFGNPHDVTYELTIDGDPQSGRCTSGATSQIVCRVYGPGGE